MKSKHKIEPLPSKSRSKAGKFDRAGRWYPNDEYIVPGSFNVRSPSRAWPFSYLKHLFTLKYARLLAEHRPDLYVSLHEIDQYKEPRKYMDALKISENSKLGQEILIAAARSRILKSAGIKE